MLFVAPAIWLSATCPLSSRSIVVSSWIGSVRSTVKVNNKRINVAASYRPRLVLSLLHRVTVRAYVAFWW